MRYVVTIVLLSALACRAADWHAGAGAGYGLYNSAKITAPAGTAETSIGPRYALTAYGGRRITDYVDLDGAWTFQDGDFEIRSGGRKTAFDAHAHSVHGSLVAYFLRSHSTLRPFVEAGGGVKFYQGIEAPSTRPLEEFATFHNVTDARALITFGGGVDWNFSNRWTLRIDFRDYTTPFPASIVVPAPGGKVSGWLHDFLPTAVVTFH